MGKRHIFGFAICVIVATLVFSFIKPEIASANSYHWGFTKSKDGMPADAGAKFETILKEHGAFYRGNPNKKVIYLTFDNGFENGYTEGILDTLKKEKVPATFFLTGHYLTSASDLVKRMIKEGHIIGNHSYGHPDMSKLSDEELVKEWKKFDEKLKEVAGIERTYYVRPPKGIFSERDLRVGNEHGYTHIFWDTAFVDWHADSTVGWEYAYDELMTQLHPGAVILLHTVAKHNADALPKFIEDAKKEGYTFGTLDDLVMENLTE
ncbi:delta-lactam-biosynthetic de-N-acetylase [Lysinibacillus endophyticus]|uniref:Delta-lactam-biosynthetic de-N-acetylase n=1 Tax=Ureibacillus endophyticus TaxID=1978490 RepID=A0A494Z9U7_9BACL|nr:delta-lactam-biosynthetic de-N-acetylase [Lysinibacillus endophyticus]MCP1145964.1 delta-lactam-biosynthetic de-N-acetylase [Lysinibacillus endophyticus]RKQ19405.1 delta-lactam-biosynthetic de-N-acetylase [Lysinibacillus endophyticus]